MIALVVRGLPQKEAHDEELAQPRWKTTSDSTQVTQKALHPEACAAKVVPQVLKQRPQQQSFQTWGGTPYWDHLNGSMSTTMKCRASVPQSGYFDVKSRVSGFWAIITFASLSPRAYALHPGDLMKGWSCARAAKSNSNWRCRGDAFCNSGLGDPQELAVSDTNFRSFCHQCCQVITAYQDQDISREIPGHSVGPLTPHGTMDLMDLWGLHPCLIKVILAGEGLPIAAGLGSFDSREGPGFDININYQKRDTRSHVVIMWPDHHLFLHGVKNLWYVSLNYTILHTLRQNHANMQTYAATPLDVAGNSIANTAPWYEPAINLCRLCRRGWCIGQAITTPRNHLDMIWWSQDVAGEFKTWLAQNCREIGYCDIQWFSQDNIPISQYRCYTMLYYVISCYTVIKLLYTCYIIVILYFIQWHPPEALSRLFNLSAHARTAVLTLE